MKIHIYSLDCPTTGKIQYIGKTIDLDRRYKQHLRDKRYNKKCQWIRGLKSNGVKPLMTVLESFDSNENYNFWEDWYIQYYKYIGFDLKNSKGGGDGGFLSQETKDKISAKHKGRKKTAEHLSKVVGNLRPGNNKGIPLTDKKRKQLFDGLKKYRLENKDKNCNSKINRQTAELIKEDIKNKVKRSVTMEKFGITKFIYADILRGKTWKS